MKLPTLLQRPVSSSWEPLDHCWLPLRPRRRWSRGHTLSIASRTASTSWACASMAESGSPGGSAGSRYHSARVNAANVTAQTRNRSSFSAWPPTWSFVLLQMPQSLSATMVSTCPSPLHPAFVEPPAWAVGADDPHTVALARTFGVTMSSGLNRGRSAGQGGRGRSGGKKTETF